MPSLSLADRALGYRLGLGDLADDHEICHSYVCGCLCSMCVEPSEPLPAPESPAQPWEARAA